MYDLLVYIGRFQPYHAGHEYVTHTALTMAKNVLILVGGTNNARSVDNPFRFTDVMDMIKEAHPEGNLSVKALRDYKYQDSLWLEQVQSIIQKHAFDLMNRGGFANHGWKDAKIGIIGHDKDSSSYYLKMFPDFTSVTVDAYYTHDGKVLNAKDIREWFYNYEELSLYDKYVFGKDIVEAELSEMSPTYWEHIEYKETWGKGPFVTADALVQVGTKILLIRRQDGSLALPGGFINNNETFLDASIRELREETRIKVPEKVLRGSIVSNEIFDNPTRDPRARIITAAFHYKLDNEMSLPEVRGSDDAKSAHWDDICNLDILSDQFYADHYYIIKRLLCTHP